MSYAGEHKTDFLCNRCGVRPPALTMSRFNTDMICFTCEEKEKQHPAYAAELAAVMLDQRRYT